MLTYESRHRNSRPLLTTFGKPALVHAGVIEIDQQVAHLWMVRTFLKHADEAEDDEDLRDIVRDIYDFILAVGPLDEVEDEAVYLKMAKKKLGKLRRATELYEEIQPEVSGHTNFVMAAKSLRLALDRMQVVISEWTASRSISK